MSLTFWSVVLVFSSQWNVSLCLSSSHWGVVRSEMRKNNCIKFIILQKWLEQVYHSPKMTRTVGCHWSVPSKSYPIFSWGWASWPLCCRQFHKRLSLVTWAGICCCWIPYCSYCCHALCWAGYGHALCNSCHTYINHECTTPWDTFWLPGPFYSRTCIEILWYWVACTGICNSKGVLNMVNRELLCLRLIVEKLFADKLWVGGCACDKMLCLPV